MRGTLALLLLLAVATAALDIAIIGAGIGGGAAAYFARETLGPDTRITVFEKEDRVGGRVHDVTIGGLRVEAGASIYHKVNLYVHNFTRLFNLTTAVAGGGGSSGGHMGIWNGREMVFEDSDWSLVTIAKLLWRYHLSPVKLRSLTNAVLEKWQGVYDLFNQGVAFDTVQEWLDRLNLTDLIRVDLRTHLLAAGCSESFVSELITAVTRVQYGQDASLHALVGLVSLVGAEDGNLLYLPGGNDQIVSALLAHAKANVILSTPVHTVERVGSCRYRIDARGEYDAVLLALPLEESGVRFVGFDAALALPADRPFRTTHSTFVKANSLNEKYFATASLGAVDQILTTEGLPFNSIAHKGVADDGQHVYKVFSRTPLTEELRSALFLNGTIATTFPWRAYPLLTPFADAKSAPPSFILAPSLVYLNAFESAISCMETSVLAARNAVNLIAKQTLARFE